MHKNLTFSHRLFRSLLIIVLLVQFTQCDRCKKLTTKSNNSEVTDEMLQQTENKPSLARLHRALLKISDNESIDWSVPPYEEQVLREAIELGNQDIIALLLKKGATVTINILWESLHANVAFEILAQLIDHASLEVLESMDPKMKVDEHTPLMFASHKGDLKLVQQLIQKKVNINKKNSQNNTALQLAIRNNQLEIIDYLLRNGAVVEEQVLINSIKNASINDKTVSVIIQHADAAIINYQDPTNDYTALMLAAEKGNKTLVEALLQKHADKTFTNSTGKTALDLAIENGHTEIVHLLHTPEEESAANKLWEALESGNFALAGQLIDQAKLDVLNSKHKSTQQTPLMYTINQEQWEVANQLTKKHVNLRAMDKLKKTVLMYAVEKGNLAFIQILFPQASSSIHQQNDVAETALRIAINKNYPAIAEFLIQQGATVHLADLLKVLDTHPINPSLAQLAIEKAEINTLNDQDSNGITPLMLATKNGNQMLVESILKRGVDINITNNNGDSALSLAIQHNNQNVADILSNAGGKITSATLWKYLEKQDFDLAGKLIHYMSKDELQKTDTLNKYTPLLFVVEKGKADLINLLISKGVDINQAHKNHTALSLALQENRLLIAKFLLDNHAEINKKVWKQALSNYNSNQEIYPAIVDKASKALLTSETLSEGTPLAFAANKGDLTLVEKLVAAKQATLEEQGIFDALDNAFKQKQIQIIDCLINAIASSKIDISTNALLEKAFNYPLSEQSLKILIKHTTVEAVNDAKSSFTLLEKLIQKNAKPQVEMLLDKPGIQIRPEAFYQAALQNDDSILASLKTKADINTGQNDMLGYTPLMLAVKATRPDAVNKLLENGADIDHQNPKNSNRTALIEAVSSENPNMIGLLIKKRANPDLKDSYSGYTALLLATEKDKIKLVEQLLTANQINLDIQVDDGQTALMGAVQNNNKKIVKALLTKGAKTNIQDNQGKTALMHTLAYEDIDEEIINLLLANGADKKLKNNQGQTAYDIAVAKGAPQKILDLLKP